MRRTSATTSTTTQLLQRVYLTASPSPSPPVYSGFLYFLSPYPRDTLDALHFMSLYSKEAALLHAAQVCMESSPRSRPSRWCLYCIVSTNAALASCAPCVFAFLSSSSSSSLSASFFFRWSLFFDCAVDGDTTALVQCGNREGGGEDEVVWSHHHHPRNWREER